MRREVLFPLIKSSFLMVVISHYLLTYSFSRSQKDQAIQKRGCRCQYCHESFESDELFAHHILPVSMGGKDCLKNMALVCAECHQLVDYLAIEEGELMNGIFMHEVQSEYPELIGNEKKWRKATKRFSNLHKRKRD